MQQDNRKNETTNRTESGKTKLSFIERVKLRAEKKKVELVIRQARKKLSGIKKKAKLEVEEREKIYKAILMIGDAIPIEDENGNKITRKDMEAMNGSELTDLWEVILNDFAEQTTGE